MRKLITVFLTIFSVLFFGLALSFFFKKDENSAIKIEEDALFKPFFIKKIDSSFSSFFFYKDEILIPCFNSKILIFSKKDAREERTFVFKESPFSSPLSQKENLIFASCDNGKILGIDTQSGKEIWQKKLEEKSVGGIVISNKTDKIYVASNDGKVFVLNSKTGDLLNEFKSSDAVNAQVVVDENTIYFGNCAGDLYALNEVDFSVKWKVNLESYIPNSPVLHADKIYVSTHTGIVFCLDKKTGSICWKYSSSDSSITSQIKLKNEKVLVCDSENLVSILDAKTGALVAKKSFESQIKELVFIKDKIVAFQNLGAVLLLDATTLNLEKKYEFRVRYYNFFADENLLCVGDYDNNIYLFNTEDF